MKKSERIAIEGLINDRAEAPEQSSGFWLNDRVGDLGYYEGDLCKQCVRTMPILASLVMCHLFSMLGGNLAPGHEWEPERDRGYQGCLHCKEWLHSPDKTNNRPCRSIPGRIVDRLDEVVDGGWAIEHDSMVTCDFCGIDIYICPTDYCCQQELDHWEDCGPPADGYQWWQLSEILDNLSDEQWIVLQGLMKKWGVS